MLEGSNYYDILGIPPNSLTIEIKKAYFSLVRKYPPERYPEEFKKIREAYNTLSSEEGRKTYDSSISGRIGNEYYDKAVEAYDEDNYSEAVSLFKKFLEISPGSQAARNLLGLCYFHMDDFSSGIDIFKSLVRDFPKESSYICNLGSGLTRKGALKQAEEAFKTSLRLDSSDIHIWSELSFCYLKQNKYAKAREALLQGIRHCGEDTSTYMKLINIDIAVQNMEDLNKDVSRLEKLAQENEELRDNTAWALTDIASSCIGKMPEFAAKLLAKAKKLKPDEKEIKSLHREASKANKLQEPFERMYKDPAIHLWIKDILKGIIFGYGSEIQEMDLSICERLLIRKPQHVVSSVKRLKSEYPEIFNTHKKFLQTILDNPSGSNIDERELKSDMRRADILTGNNEIPSHGDIPLDDVFIPPMQAINSDRTGRNDPCPCGSGKKYKKCCLAG